MYLGGQAATDARDIRYLFKRCGLHALDRTEVAKHLGVRVETVSRWTTAGTIPCLRIGKRSVRYLLPQIVSQLRRRKKGGNK